MHRLGIFALLTLMGMAFLVAGSRLSSSEPANAMDVFDPSSLIPRPKDRTAIGVLERRIPYGVLEAGAAIALDYSKQSDSLRGDSEPQPMAVGSDQKVSDVLSEQKEGFIKTGLNETPEKLLIPTLRVNAKIVSVPFSGMTWDISDLGQDIAWLGSPTGKNNRNNIVLAGHVTLYDGRNGPLYSAARLKPGDMVYVYSANRVYSYLLQSVSTVYPQDISLLEETASPQLTLITCTTWDEKTSSYLRRLVFQFSLAKVEPRLIRVSQ
jgi:LPXTG-site transpeptidase (sortase) family protein